jgi:hypothetical protein
MFKTMLVCSLNHSWIVHCEFIAQAQVVNQLCYLEVLTRLQESVLRKDQNLGCALAYDVLSFREFLAKKAITKTDPPPYSLDLVPCNFLLFPKLKITLKGQGFADIPDIQCNVTMLV